MQFSLNLFLKQRRTFSFSLFCILSVGMYFSAVFMCPVHVKLLKDLITLSPLLEKKKKSMLHEQLHLKKVVDIICTAAKINTCG